MTALSRCVTRSTWTTNPFLRTAAASPRSPHMWKTQASLLAHSSIRRRSVSSLPRFLSPLVKVLAASPSIRSDASGDTHGGFFSRNDRKVRFSRATYAPLVSPEAADWLETPHEGIHLIRSNNSPRTYGILVPKKVVSPFFSPPFFFLSFFLFLFLLRRSVSLCVDSRRVVYNYHGWLVAAPTNYV